MRPIILSRLAPAAGIVACIGLLGAPAATAQIVTVAAGPYVSSLDWSSSSSSSDTDALASPYGGLQVVLPGSRHLAFGTGASVVEKGGSHAGVELRAWYLEVPALAVLQTGPRNALFLEAGPSLGLRVVCRRTSGEFRATCGRDTLPQPGPTAQLYPIRRMDLSWVLGAGGRFTVENRLAVVTLRVHLGLLDLHPDPSQTLRSRGFSLVLGYQLDLPDLTPDPPGIS